MTLLVIQIGKNLFFVLSDILDGSSGNPSLMFVNKLCFVKG